MFTRLNTQLNKPTNQNWLQSPKLWRQRIRKYSLQNFGDQCNKQHIVYVLVCPEAAEDEAIMKKVEADFIAAVNSMKKVFETSQVSVLSFS